MRLSESVFILKSTKLKWQKCLEVYVQFALALSDKVGGNINKSNTNSNNQVLIMLRDIYDDNIQDKL